MGNTFGGEWNGTCRSVYESHSIILLHFMKKNKIKRNVLTDRSITDIQVSVYGDIYIFVSIYILDRWVADVA